MSAKMEKRFLILERLIEEYIANPVPISSKYLQTKLPIEVSSATVRYYFKQLTESGYLQKQHVSSGRVPSSLALKNYWRNRLKQKEFWIESQEALDKVCQEGGLFCEYSLYENCTFHGVEAFKNRFLILLFDERELVIPYNKNIERFLYRLIGKEAADIANILQEYDMVALGRKIKEFLQEDFKIYHINEIVQMAIEDKAWADAHLEYVLSGKKLALERPGVTFYKNFLGYKFYISIKNIEKKRGEVLLLGQLHKNFTRYIQNLQRSVS